MEYFFILNRDHRVLALNTPESDGFILPSSAAEEPDISELHRAISESLGINVSYQGTKGSLHIWLYSGLELPEAPAENMPVYVWMPLMKLRDTGDNSIAEGISGREAIGAYEEIMLKGHRLGDGVFRIWTFGNCEHLSSELAELVMEGKKKGAAALLWAYEVEKEDIPAAGDLAVVTDWFGKPLMMLEITWARAVPFNEVDEEQALSEGEGDMSVEYWRRVHWSVFAPECRALGMEPTEEMPIVCERFRLINIL